tara:strand:+ start:10746 stop:11183 length:438 start_codon:yes stop_codon:yes gene_type:complete
MKYPYCIIDGVEYQLEMVNQVIRFPDTKTGCSDLNRLISDYYSGKISLDVVWDEYTQTGSSYYMVEGLFSPCGINNHTVTQGKGKCKDMVLCSGDPEVDEQYNYTEEDKLVYGLVDLCAEEIYDLSREELITTLETLTEKLKTIK